MGQKSAGRKKEKWLRPTENREGKTQASYHQYFIYLHYHVFKHLHSIYTEQTGTAFYAKEEGRQEKQRNKKLISTWKNIRMGKSLPEYMQKTARMPVKERKRFTYYTPTC